MITISEMIMRVITDCGAIHVVVSPGARCAPLIQAAVDSELQVTPIVDERVAAFFALGMAYASGKPVALIATSGTAMLNYAPALAEAFYRNIPLIAITADRPQAWVDRADSQTIRQPGALDAVMKRSVALPPLSARGAARHSFLLLNEAIFSATHWPQGPVHINVPIDFADEPFEMPFQSSIDFISPNISLSNEVVRELVAPWRDKKVLIVAGGCAPSPRLNKAISRLSRFGNVAILAEPTANIHAPRIIRSFDPIIATLGDTLAPDLAITLGDPLISASLKGLLRRCGATHWAVGPLVGQSSLPDTFGHLSRMIFCPPADFLLPLASALEWQDKHTPPRPISNDYVHLWLSGRVNADMIAHLPWCSLSALNMILQKAPKTWNIHSSNGLTVRQLALLDSLHGPWHRVSCNRGVSGIDGSTSTALGESTVSSAPTLLLTGDMSALYDIGALASRTATVRFKTVVFDNGGGAIFNFSKATRALPCRDAALTLAGKVNPPLRGLADDCGMRYYQASNADELRRELPRFLSDNTFLPLPAILHIITDGKTDADIYHQFISSIN
ncbi:MAG: 2-succinyl-5-enolpyruvyl-6-hydroxy-3-cyclohexene-1-carboxylic-acid synthase [Pseudoflavonifractor sp.]|nr:2-succinyl-5-enolpyruvyl-6-hydroxy-3-cyclohexene-1-carboxylic-acid synthase [Alloprevotella sp.]MCM1116852.1 2-succinyl-5-enolpyruvyl-6-hydroxy-3-cyclohexene-1-carboxylic-acid synthase [Pseudoflavonifractor sp.]